MGYLIFFLNLVLFAILGLVCTANGQGPAGLKPVQDILKPAANAVAGAAGPLGIVAVIWGFWGLIFFFVSIEALGYGGGALSHIINLFGILVLIVVGTLAGYVSVAAFFGAPASGAGKVVDWIKRSFGGAESIFGIIALIFALWTLTEFILNRSGVYI